VGCRALNGRSNRAEFALLVVGCCVHDGECSFAASFAYFSFHVFTEFFYLVSVLSYVPQRIIHVRTLNVLLDWNDGAHACIPARSQGHSAGAAGGGGRPQHSRQGGHAQILFLFNTNSASTPLHGDLQNNKTAAEWARTPEIRALIDNYSKLIGSVLCVQKSSHIISRD
jgi:hypothetical protein